MSAVRLTSVPDDYLMDTVYDPVARLADMNVGAEVVVAGYLGQAAAENGGLVRGVNSEQGKQC